MSSSPGKNHCDTLRAYEAFIMEDNPAIDYLEQYFRTKNITFLAIKFEQPPPENWLLMSYTPGTQNSAVIDGTAWHQFSSWQEAFSFSINYQGLSTPFGIIEVFTLDLPADTTFLELVEAVYDLKPYDGAPPA